MKCEKEFSGGREYLNYINFIWKKEGLFKAQSAVLSPNRSNIEKNYFLVRSVVFLFNSAIGILDFLILTFRLFVISSLNNRKIGLLFLAKNFCVNVNDVHHLRIARDIFQDETIFINSSKEIALYRVNGKKVYNIGFFVKFVAFFVCREDKLLNQFLSYTFVNNVFFKFFNVIKSVNYFWFYDLNSFSIIFSKYRQNLKLVEIQHGSIINYPPYELPAPVKIADVFYVRNEITVSYLKNHLCKDYNCEYRILDYPVVNREVVEGINILYASTIEFHGFHPVFKSFLKGYRSVFPDQKLNLTIRLHPRERGKENLFIDDLQNSNVDFKFDNSENWLLSNSIQGLIVISPWSSTLEEAFDNGYRSITIDEVGRKRFSHFISEGSFLYSDNLIKTLGNWDYLIS